MGSALESLMSGVGVPAPQIKPGGRRKRAVQARLDVLGTLALTLTLTLTP